MIEQRFSFRDLLLVFLGDQTSLFQRLLLRQRFLQDWVDELVTNVHMLLDTIAPDFE